MTLVVAMNLPNRVCPRWLSFSVSAVFLATMVSPPPVSAERTLPPPAAEGRGGADLGNGTFRNPVLAGDRPDPSVLKHGKDYYIFRHRTLP